MNVNYRLLNKSISRTYTIFLKEKTYLSIFVNFRNHNFKENSNNIKQKTFFDIKRTIKYFRHFPSFFFEKDLSINCFILFSYTNIIMLINILNKQQNTVNKYTNKALSISSIHIAFEFIEREWEHCNSLLKLYIFNIYHPEILLRLLRVFILDTSFLHLLRIYFYSTFLRKNIRINFSKIIRIQLNEIFFLLLKEEILTNISLELNKFIFFKKKYIYLSIERINIYKKFNYINNKQHILQLFKPIAVKDNKLLTVSNFVQSYLMYNKLFFINSNICEFNNFLFSIYIIFLIKQRIGVLTEFKLLDKSICIEKDIFLGYLFHNHFDIFPISINTGLTYHNLFFVKKTQSLLSPVYYMFKRLAYYKFCNINQSPLSKKNWSNLETKMIINRFETIIYNLLYYYSGCHNKKLFFQILYTLRYSCIKTLAYKHKSTINNLLRNNQSIFSKKFIYDLNIKYSSLKKRFWNFKIYKVYRIIN